MGDGEQRIFFPIVTRSTPPSASPPPGRILFSSDRGATSDIGYASEIWVMNGDGSDQTQLTDIGARNVEARWPPDGQKIVFTRFTNDNSEGGRWSPDGAWITFLYRDPYQFDRQIMIMDANGNNITALTTLSDNVQPEWQPSQQPIAAIDETRGVGRKTAAPPTPLNRFPLNTSVVEK